MCAVVSMNAVSVGWGKRDKGIMVPCLDFTWGIASIGPSYLERTMAAGERLSEFVPECVQPPDLILRACDFIDFCVFRHESNQALTTPGNAENRIKSQILSTCRRTREPGIHDPCLSKLLRRLWIPGSRARARAPE